MALDHELVVLALDRTHDTLDIALIDDIHIIDLITTLDETESLRLNTDVEDRDRIAITDRGRKRRLTRTRSPCDEDAHTSPEQHSFKYARTHNVEIAADQHTSMPICEFSGEDTDRLITVRIEGVTMRVAPKYAKYGEKVEEAPAAPTAHPRRIVKQERRIAPERTEVVRSDASTIIKNAFQKLGVEETAFAKRIGMKESAFKSYLRGDLAIPIADARVLEKNLHVTIVEASREPATEETTKTYTGKSSSTLTFADLLKNAKRR